MANPAIKPFLGIADAWRAAKNAKCRDDLDDNDDISDTKRFLSGAKSQSLTAKSYSEFAAYFAVSAHRSLKSAVETRDHNFNICNKCNVLNV